MAIHDWKILDFTGHMQDISVLVSCGYKTKTDKPCLSNVKYCKKSHYFFDRHAESQGLWYCTTFLFFKNLISKNKFFLLLLCLGLGVGLRSGRISCSTTQTTNTEACSTCMTCILYDSYTKILESESERVRERDRE